MQVFYIVSQFCWANIFVASVFYLWLSFGINIIMAIAAEPDQALVYMLLGKFMLSYLGGFHVMGKNF